MVIFLKKFAIINTFLTFFFGFLIHGIYSWYPSVITSIFPVNESLYEHIKLIFYSPIFSSIILYFIFKKKGIPINNLVYGLLVSTLFNIFLFYLIFIPVYRETGENIVITLGIYFITICVSQYLNYLIICKDNHKLLNIISAVILLIATILLTYLTYHPKKNDFFRDPKTNQYGIKK